MQPGGKRLQAIEGHKATESNKSKQPANYMPKMHTKRVRIARMVASDPCVISTGKLVCGPIFLFRDLDKKTAGFVSIKRIA